MWKITNRNVQSPRDDAVFSLALRLANHLALKPAERARLAALIALDEDLEIRHEAVVEVPWTRQPRRSYCSM